MENPTPKKLHILKLIHDRLVTVFSSIKITRRSFNTPYLPHFIPIKDEADRRNNFMHWDLAEGVWDIAIEAKKPPTK